MLMRDDVVVFMLTIWNRLDRDGSITTEVFRIMRCRLQYTMRFPWTFQSLVLLSEIFAVRAMHYSLRVSQGIHREEKLFA